MAVEEQTEDLRASVPVETPNEEVEFLEEGTPEATAYQQTQQQQQQQTQAAVTPAAATDLAALKAQLDLYQQQLKQQQQRPSYEQPPVYQPPVKQETPEERNVRLQGMFITDPVKATQEVTKEAQLAMAQTIIDSNQKLSKEVVMSNPDSAKLYGKWKDEVEQTVRSMTPQEKFQNPLIYQTALERVKASHSSELLQEQIQAGVEQALRNMGIDPAKQQQQKPAVPTGAGKESGTASTVKRTVVIPRSIVEQAEREGVNPVFYYNRLKEQGRIK